MRRYLYVFLLLVLWCCSSFAATNVSTIGTTSRNYSTITAWETAVDGDLVTAGDIEKGECYDDSDFDEAVVIDGSTTDANNYIWLTAASGERHDGTHQPLKGVVNSRGANTGDVFVLSDDFTRFEDFIILDGGGANEHVKVLASNCTIRNIISHTPADHSIQFNGSDNTLINYISIDANDDAIYFINSSSGNYVAGCLAWNTVGGRGFQVGNGSSVEWINCISLGSNGDDFDDTSGTGTPTESFNLSSDATATGTGSVINCVATTDDAPAAGIWIMFENISSGTEDFHLKPAVSEVNEAEGAGTDVSGTTGYTFDIDLETRSAQDIGPDEITIAGVAFIPRIQMF